MRTGLIGALTDYTAPYTKGCTPPSATSWKDPDNNVAFHNKTTVMTHNATISIAAKWLDDMNNAALTPEQREEAKKNYTERIRTAGFPSKPDGSKMVYRTAVKTGVVFKDAKNKARAKEFVAFLLQEENLTPYVEGSLGRWFPVTKAGQAARLLEGRPASPVGVQPVRRGHGAFRIHQELQVHGAQQRERVGQGDEPRRQRQGAGGQGGRRDDRAHQDGRSLIALRRRGRS